MVEQIKYGTHEDQHYDVYENQQAQFNAWIVLIHGDIGAKNIANQ